MAGRVTIFALDEVVQLRIEYAYEREALLDDDLGSVISASCTVPFRKSHVIFRI